MSKFNSSKGKHLTIEDRIFIEYALDEQYSLKEIAERLGKDPTTISKEVKKNRVVSTTKRNKDLLHCKNHSSCNKKHLCKKPCSNLCKKCAVVNCHRICPEYSSKICLKLTRFPYVCNGCIPSVICRNERYQYRAKVAEASYRAILTSSREGLNLTAEQLKDLDELISPLIIKGQSISHIYSNHKQEINCSERTIYKYFDKNAFTAKNIDLPRKVKFKPRKKRYIPLSEDKTHRIGRTYEDFKLYIEKNPDASVVEMDTVHGTNSGKVLLTFFFRKCSLMIAFIIDSCTQSCVKLIMDELCEILGVESFKRSFPILLTDNGSEFKKPELLEHDDNGSERTKIFYCNPMASYQKPHIEKNHEYIRYIFPKGKSLNKFTQREITLAINHINSTARASLNGNSPFILAQMLMDNVLLEKLSLIQIPADEVHLKPALLKK
jgi:transposase, IS30 family